MKIRATMHAQGLVHRETANIRTQLSVLERSYDATVRWLVQNGYDGRIPDAATVAVNPLPFGVRATGKSSNPVEAYVLRGCRYFYVLDSVKRQPTTSASATTNPSMAPSRAPVAHQKPRYSWVLKKNGVTGNDDESGGYESSSESEAGGDESAGIDEAAYGARNPHSKRRGRVVSAANHDVAERRHIMTKSGQDAQRDMMVKSWRSFKTEQQDDSYSRWSTLAGSMNAALPTSRNAATGLGSDGRFYNRDDGSEVATTTATEATTRTPSGADEYHAAAVGDIGCGTATFGVNPPFGGRIPTPADCPERFPTQFYLWADFDEYLREFCAVTYQPFYAHGA